MLAVISGATRGIGRALSIAFAEMGFDLAIGARNEDELTDFKNYLENTFPKIKILVKSTDFSDKNQVQEFTKAIKKKFGSVEVIVNNVGQYRSGTISEEEDGILESQIQTNLYSAYYLTRAFLEEMKSKKCGHIFNICSITSKEVRKEAASYSISKFALLGFNRVLAEEMRDYQVKVTAIMPGSVNTSSWDGIDAPKDEFVQVKDVVDAVLNSYQLSKSCLVEEIIIKPINNKY
jgi:3-oxoacyl-[acyl-carrier protein] reductase